MKFVSELKRTHYCGKLDAKNDGQTVVLMGWVDGRRDHGGLVFIDLRDREGIIQVVLNPSNEDTKVSKDFRGEYVVALQGVVRKRPEGMRNTKIPTGEVEVEATRAEILSYSKTLPFQITDDNVGEMLRLKYRYLDLRSSRLQKNLRLRHEFSQLVRREMSKQGFLEVETPILYKSTPEGARDYLVPSRVHPGMFYALPQSPQTLKQLLMIAGYDKYFQIAKCFRDEDLRADRQPEFTQVDIELSFADMDDVMKLTEGIFRTAWKELKGQEIGPIPVMTFQQAMDKYGSDKPDIRFGMEIQDLAAVFKNSGFKVFDDVTARGGILRGVVAPGCANYSRGQLDKLTELAKRFGAKGLVWIKGDGTSSVSKFFAPEKIKEALTVAGAKQDDLLLIVADDFDPACAALSALRLHLGRELGLIKDNDFKFLWVIDFPLFEYSPEEKRWVARHHPFTSPKDEFIEHLVNFNESYFQGMLAKAYDFVCNGYEIGGGSIRIHRTEVQNSMFKALGFSEEEKQLKFGFFLEALQYGTPPHGGIAWGLDRIVMLLSGTDAIREVMAFPKTAKAADMMSSTPSTVTREQLLELGIRLSPVAEKNVAEHKGFSEADT